MSFEERRTLNRRQSIAEIQQGSVWDILIIGGGAAGLGCALDASLRGYRTLLLEKNDFASGTSSRSSKMIHGGVRYLKQGNIPLVKSSLREREILFQRARDLVKEKRFIIPLYGIWDIGLYLTGMRIYDLLARQHRMQKSQLLSAATVQKRFPNLYARGLKGGIAYSDGCFDDSRLAISIAQSAAQRGATLLNYAAVVGLLKAASADSLEGVKMRDMQTGREYEIRSRLVINATGVFVDSVLTMDNSRRDKMHRISQGSHIILPAEFLPGNNAMLIPQTSDGRVLFCIPWHKRLLVGTTDVEVAQPMEEPRPLPHEIDFLLETCGRYLTKKPDASAILSMFAAERPLQYGKGKTKELSREHRIHISSSGLVSILGGKWTTYRAIAEEALDKGLASIGEKYRHPRYQLPFSDLREEMHHIERDAETRSLVSPYFTYTIADIIAAVRYEMAMTLIDVMARRTRMLFLHVRAARQCASQVTHIMAKELGENNSWIRRQEESFYRLADRYLP